MLIGYARTSTADQVAGLTERLHRVRVEGQLPPNPPFRLFPADRFQISASRPPYLNHGLERARLTGSGKRFLVK